ncbi:MAG: hypothetical protein ABIJ36_01025 [Patescibacteria group bacterium]|nr:hypothetical protein [Patescibacteria group bacterium]
MGYPNEKGDGEMQVSAGQIGGILGDEWASIEQVARKVGVSERVVELVRFYWHIPPENLSGALLLVEEGVSFEELARIMRDVWSEMVEAWDEES